MNSFGFLDTFSLQTTTSSKLIVFEDNGFISKIPENNCSEISYLLMIFFLQKFVKTTKNKRNRNKIFFKKNFVPEN
jgi:hypothetical protein